MCLGDEMLLGPRTDPSTRVNACTEAAVPPGIHARVFLVISSPFLLPPLVPLSCSPIHLPAPAPTAWRTVAGGAARGLQPCPQKCKDEILR